MKSDDGVFCILPWIHAQVRQNGDVYPCCRVKHKISYGSTLKQPLAEIWNSEEIKKIRREMLNGVPQSFCADCYNVEKLGHVSHRQHVNRVFSHEYPRTAKTDQNGHLQDQEIVYLDIRFSNVCNLKCRSCTPDSSNSWHDDHIKLFGRIDDPQKVRRLALDSKTAIADIDQLLPKMQRIYFAGGEPLLDENHYLLLEKLIKLGRTDVVLIYNSNASHLKYKKWNVLQLWQNFKAVQMSASIDAIGAPMELIRKGANWEETIKNLRMVRAFCPKVGLQIYPTVGILNCYLLPELIGYFLKNDFLRSSFNLDLNILNDPEYLNVAMLEPQQIAALEKIYFDFLNTIEADTEVRVFEHIRSELGRVIKHAHSQDLSGRKKEFHKFTESLDRIRNETTYVLIPELAKV